MTATFFCNALTANYGFIGAMYRLLSILIVSSFLAACATKPVEVVNQPNTSTSFVIQDDIAVRPEIKADFEKAVNLLQEKDYERGIRLMNRVSERSEKSIAPYINLGIAYRITGEMKLAEKSLNKALAINSIHPMVNNELGIVYRKTGRFSEARRIYERILERFTLFMPARKNLGILCDLYINDLSCARANYEIYNKADPGDKNVAMWLVDLRNRMEN